MLRSLVALAGITAVAAFAPLDGANAQFPERPITIVVSASAGGSVDGLSRTLAPHWEALLGQPINVENHGGAGGVTGIRHFMAQEADGYTIWVGTEAHFSTAVEKTEGLSADDLAVINLQQFTPSTWFVLESSPYQTMEDVIEAAAENPDSIIYGAPPTGNTVISAGVVEQEWGVDMRFVPQAGGSETDVALLGGHIDIKIGTAGDITEVEGMRALAVAAPERLDFLPDVPTFNEIAEAHGFAKMPNIGTGRVVAVRAEVRDEHPEIWQRLTETYAEAFNKPEYQQRLEDTGQALSTAFHTPEEATALVKELVENSAIYQAKYGVR